MVKLRAYSIFKVEGIILPTDLKGDLLKKIGILFLKVSMRLCVCGLAAYIKMLISRLHSADYNLIS